MRSSVEPVSSSGVALPVTDHQLCNPADSTASLINGSCQRECQSIGCSFWVCLGVGEELCILRCSAQWLAKSRLYWFLSSLLFVKKYPTADLKDLRHCSTSAATRYFFSNSRAVALCFWKGAGKAWWAVRVEDDWRTQSKASAATFYSFPPPCSLSSLTQRKYCILTGSHWIHVVIHRPISNCQAAKLHKVCQNSSQERAGDVKN